MGGLAANLAIVPKCEPKVLGRDGGGPRPWVKEVVAEANRLRANAGLDQCLAGED